jgi:hypothetical protein
MELMIEDVDSVLPVKMPKRYETHMMNLGAFVKRLNTVTEQFNVVNELLDDVTIPKGSSAVSGLWYPEDLLPENGSGADIRVIWHPHPSSHRVKITPTIWARRRYYFWQRVAHELVHRYQDLDRPEDTTARTFKVRVADSDMALEQKKYYSDYDELEAYAHDAAMEMLTWWPDLPLPQAIGRANQVDTDAVVWSTYHNYLTTFETGHPARTHFRRKVRQWYQAMRQTPEFYTKLALQKLV